MVHTSLGVYPTASAPRYRMRLQRVPSSSSANFATSREFQGRNDMPRKQWLRLTQRTVAVAHPHSQRLTGILTVRDDRPLVFGRRESVAFTHLPLARYPTPRARSAERGSNGARRHRRRCRRVTNPPPDRDSHSALSHAPNRPIPSTARRQGPWHTDTTQDEPRQRS